MGRAGKARVAVGLLLALLLPWPLSVDEPAAAAGQNMPGVVVVDGIVRSYLLHVPPGYDPTEPVPLVVGLHGAGSSGVQFGAGTELDKGVDERGWLAVFPDGVLSQAGARSWNAGICCSPATDLGVDDVGFVTTLIDQLTSTLQIDERRIYVTGHSNGGILAYRLACELPNRIAAIAPVAAAIDDTTTCAPGHPMSVLHIHGREDERVPYEGGVSPVGVFPIDWPSVDDAMARWRTIDRCTGPRRQTVEGRVRVIRWAPCSPEGEVRLIAVSGAGHDWPGDWLHPNDPIAATDTMLDFFGGHRLLAGFTPHGYVDVPANAAYSYALDWQADADLLYASAAHEFRPDESLRTGPAGRAVARFRGRPDPEPPAGGGTVVTRAGAAGRLFTAAGAPAGYDGAVSWARRTGVMPPYRDGEFRPGQPITRAEFVMALYRLAAKPSAWAGGAAATPYVV